MPKHKREPAMKFYILIDPHVTDGTYASIYLYTLICPHENRNQIPANPRKNINYKVLLLIWKMLIQTKLPTKWPPKQMSNKNKIIKTTFKFENENKSLLLRI